MYGGDETGSGEPYIDDYPCMRLINNRMACSGNLVKIALGQLKNVKISLATLRQFFYIFHLTLSNFPQIALQSMRLLVLIASYTAMLAEQREFRRK